MRSPLLILSLLISSILVAQKRDSVFVKALTFSVMYSEVLEQPIWVRYYVRCPNGTYPRTGMSFYQNDSIYTSNDSDYFRNIYDKGHLAPAADFNCNREMLFSTFSYLNCALQNEYLNRGTWKNLEIYERELARRYKNVEIKVLCVFSSKSIKLSTGATVPDGFYKIIKYGNSTIKFYFPNSKPIYLDYMRYRIK